VLLTSLKDFMVEYLCDDVATMSKKCSFADDVAPYVQLVAQSNAAQQQGLASPTNRTPDCVLNL
jgi:hypothetical protein